MRKPILVLLATSLFLAGCAGWNDSRINPGNWFGNSRSVTVETADQGTLSNPLIPQRRTSILSRPEAVDTSVLIADITELRVERTTTGATIYATGVASRQGAYGTSLRLDPPTEDTRSDVLTFSFRVLYPAGSTPTGTEPTRTVVEAYALTKQDLRGVRLIRVRGARNTRETRRR